MSIWSTIYSTEDGELWSERYGPPGQDSSSGLGASEPVDMWIDVARSWHYETKGLRISLYGSEPGIGDNVLRHDASVVAPRPVILALRDALTAWLDDTEETL